MKKRILGILLSLCMALMLFPATAFAEGETPEPVTQIAVEVEPPIVGEHPEYGCGYSSTPTGVIYVNLDDWYRIPKEAYTGEADDVWEGMFDTGNTCSEDYYYKVVFSVGIYSDENCYIPDDVSATINGKNCDIQVADDGNSCLLSYIFEAKVLQPVSNIAVTLDEPALGKTPDFSPEFTANPDGSVSLDDCFWYKISKDDYTGTNEDEWDEIYEDDVFEEGYYYSVDLYFIPNENYSLNEEISATVNGKPHDDTYGSVYDEFFGVAYVSGVFDPLEPPCTLTVPFTTTVKLGGNAAPGETVFTLEIVDANAGEETYKDVTVSASVTTNGAGSYTGTMTLTGPFQQLRNMLCEGAFVKQVDAGAANWTYDDTVWGLLLTEVVAFASTDDAAPEYTVLILPATCEETENGKYYDLAWDADPVDQMSFTNTYTKSTTKSASPQTGDNSNPALWFALFAVSVAGVIGTCVYSKRRRSSQAK